MSKINKKPERMRQLDTITWLFELEQLAIKHSYLGIYLDLKNTSLEEKQGMYLRLLQENKQS